MCVCVLIMMMVGGHSTLRVRGAPPLLILIYKGTGSNQQAHSSFPYRSINLTLRSLSPRCVVKMRMMHFGANDTQGASLSTDF